MATIGDPGTMVALLAAALVALAILSLALLRGWDDWLDLRRWELNRTARRGPSPAASRLELADLKDRIRRLEVIANGAEE